MNVKAFLVGTCGAVAVLIVAGVIYLVYDTHRMAQRGDAAANFIEQQLRSAQQQQKPAAK